MNNVPALGQFKGTIIQNTTPWTGSAAYVQIVNDAVFTTLTGTLAVQGTLGAITWPEGLIFGGNFTAITLSSGTVIAYDAPA